MSTQTTEAFAMYHLKPAILSGKVSQEAGFKILTSICEGNISFWNAIGWLTREKRKHDTKQIVLGVFDLPKLTRTWGDVIKFAELKVKELGGTNYKWKVKNRRIVVFKREKI